MKHANIVALTSLLVVALAPATILAADGQAPTSEAADMALRLQMEQVARNLELAPIKSEADLASYTRNVHGQWSPLNYIAPRDRADFIRSLTFNENGLTGFDYGYLTGLTAREAYELLSLFGMQSGTHRIPTRDGSTIQPLYDGEATIGDFLEDYRCESQGTCAAANFKACTSNC